MADIKVETVVTGDVEAHVVYELHQPITLKADGSGRRSVDTITVNDGILNISVVAQGTLGTEWRLTVTNVAKSSVLFDHTGMIGSSGITHFTDAVFV